jgi:uncharacterized protein YciI
VKEYLYTIQPARAALLSDGPTPDEERSISMHFEYLKALTEGGTVILAGRTLNTDESCFGIVVYRAEDDAAARAIMEGDPAVEAGVFRATLFPYRVALAGDFASGDGGGA